MHALIVDVYDSMEENIKKIENFIMYYQNDSVTIEVSEIMQKFRENTPEFSADIVYRELEGI